MNWFFKKRQRRMISAVSLLVVLISYFLLPVFFRATTLAGTGDGWITGFRTLQIEAHDVCELGVAYIIFTFVLDKKMSFEKLLHPLGFGDNFFGQRIRYSEKIMEENRRRE